MQIRELKEEEIKRSLFTDFIRHQVVEDCVRKVDGEWMVIRNPFIDDWKEEEYLSLMKELKNTVHTHGVVYGAFINEKLKGFCSLESRLFGKQKEYLDLTCIYVSEEMRGRGVGKQLFDMAVTWAAAHGAAKLYISAHSAVESQTFYKAMGCKEAKEYNRHHVEEEPYDCQLERKLE